MRGWDGSVRNQNRTPADHSRGVQPRRIGARSRVVGCSAPRLRDTLDYSLLLVQRRYADVGMPVATVVHRYPPRTAADLAVLDVFLL